MTALVNVEAEAELLGSLMNENSAIDRVADVTSADDFSEPVHGMIYAALVQQASLGKVANPITIKGFFAEHEGLKALGGDKYLMQLCANGSGLATVATAQQVADLATRRRMQAGLQAAAVDCSDLTLTPAEIVNNADAALNVTGKDTIHQPTGGECFDELIASFGKTYHGVECRVIPALDALLGPMRPKQLIIGAGRPGMGKTALALSYAIGAACNGHGVLFVSLEMSSTEIAARMAADLCFDRDGMRIPYSAIRDRDLGMGQQRLVAEAAAYMHTLPFQVVDAGNLTVGRLNMLIRRHARRMAANGHKLELVVVDYLQLLSPDTKGRSNYEAVSEVSRALKAMAKDHGVAVFALAQLSREVEKRPGNRPQLADLRDSGQIEQDADAVLFLLREEYYLRQIDPESDKDPIATEMALRAAEGKIEFILAKRRNGVTGTVIGAFHGAYQAVRGL